MTLYDWLAAQEYPAEDSNLLSDRTVFVKKGGARLLKAGGQWLFDNEIDRITGPGEGQDERAAGESCPEAGDIVQVKDFDGYHLGIGFYNPYSKIRIRMLSRYEKSSITPAFLRRRLQEAWNYRKAVIDTSSCRLVFGEADFLPGLTIDKFEDILVVESLALGTDRLKLLILK